MNKEHFLKYVGKPRMKGKCWIRYSKTGKPTRYRYHKTSYELFKGSVEKGLYVLHSCDNPYCVNPEHLWLGTQSDNVVDAILKNRFTQRDKNKIKGFKKGKKSTEATKLLIHNSLLGNKHRHNAAVRKHIKNLIQALRTLVLNQVSA